MLYDVKIQSNVHNKRNLNFENAELLMMKNAEGIAVLFVKDQLNSHKPILIPSIQKLYSAKEPHSFCFSSAVLQGSVKIIPHDHGMNDPIKTALSQIKAGTYSTDDLELFKGKISGSTRSINTPKPMDKKYIVTRNTSDLEDQKSVRGSIGGTSELGERKSAVSIPMPSPVPSKKLFSFEEQSSMPYVPVLRPTTNKWEEKARKVSSFPGYSNNQNHGGKFYNTGRPSNRFTPYTPPSKNDVEGFKNLGQTCYMSACIQLLYYSSIRGANFFNFRTYLEFSSKSFTNTG